MSIKTREPPKRLLYIMRDSVGPTSSPNPKNRRTAVHRLLAAMQQRLPHCQIEWLEGPERKPQPSNSDQKPGAGLRPGGRGATSVTMEYGGGITTLVGSGSVAVPGTVAAIERAWSLFGKARWTDLFSPAIAATRDGFPLSSACHYYLGYSGEPVFNRSDDGFFALHTKKRSLRPAESLIVIPHLAESLAAIAEEGARVFYEGEIGRAIAQHVRDGGGTLTADDLARYEAIERPSLCVPIGFLAA